MSPEELGWLAHYRVLKVLGHGGMGVVFQAEDTHLQRTVALKVILPAVAANPLARDRFLREARAGAALKSDHVVTIYQVGQDRDIPYLAMEFLEGQTLEDRLKGGAPLSVAEILRIGREAATGLAAAHARGLIHRDIKPANIWLEAPTGRVKLLDFGLARAADPTQAGSAITQAGNIVGTPEFMSPEQGRGEELDARSDLFSLGAVLYLMCSGRKPFQGTSAMAVLTALAVGSPPPIREINPNVPSALAELVERLLAKERVRRPGSADELSAALAAIEAGTPLSAGSGAHAPSSIGGAPIEAAEAFARRSPTLSRSQPEPRNEITQLGNEITQLGSEVGHAKQIGADQKFHLRSRRAVPIVLTLAAVVAGALGVGGLIWWQAARQDPSVNAPNKDKPKDPEQPPKPALFAGTVLNGGGSTFIDPLMQRWAVIYEKRQGVRIDYQSVGSTRGTQGVLNHVYLFGCSDAALTDQQLAKIKQDGDSVLHVPLALGAIVPSYNLPNVKGQVRFTGPILADIYLGKIVKWNDAALRIANPGIDLPDMPITPVHRGDQSGTSFVWTDYLSKVSGEWKTKIGATTLLKRPGGLAGTGNNGVAALVSRNVGALGYVELTYALENNLHFGQVKNGEGRFITPSVESVTAAAEALTTIPDDLRLPFTDGAGEATYPIVGASYALLHADQRSNPSGRELVAFLRWATHEGQAFVKDLRYAPLPPELVGRIDAVLATVHVASR
jgi:phosphate ABC transporter phosphate-binding protein